MEEYGEWERKKGQSDYKPGSVRRDAASVIYLSPCRRWSLRGDSNSGISFYPPTQGLSTHSNEQPSGVGLHELSASDVHSPHVTMTAGELLPHLLTLTRRRLFSSALICPRGQLSVRKRNALRCPDFPPDVPKIQNERATDRPAGLYVSWFWLPSKETSCLKSGTKLQKMCALLSFCF